MSSVLICSIAHRIFCSLCIPLTVYFALAAQALSHFPQLLPFFTYLPFLCRGVGACSLFCSVSRSETHRVNRNHTIGTKHPVLTVTVMRVSLGSCDKAFTSGTSQCQASGGWGTDISWHGQAPAGSEAKHYWDAMVCACRQSRRSKVVQAWHEANGASAVWTEMSRAGISPGSRGEHSGKQPCKPRRLVLCSCSSTCAAWNKYQQCKRAVCSGFLAQWTYRSHDFKDKNISVSS